MNTLKETSDEIQEWRSRCKQTEEDVEKKDAQLTGTEQMISWTQSLVPENNSMNIFKFSSNYSLSTSGKSSAMVLDELCDLSCQTSLRKNELARRFFS